MWLILKAEFEYTQLGLKIAYAVALFSFVTMVIFKDSDILDYTTITTITYCITMIVIGGAGDKEKRARYHAALPVTPQQLAVSNGLYVTLVQFGMVLFWVCLLPFKLGEHVP